MKISYFTHIGGNNINTGFGYAGYNIVNSLKKLGHEVPFNDKTADVQICFSHPQYFEFEEHQYKIGYFPWESTELRPGWLERLNWCDEVWVPNVILIDWLKQAGVTKPIYTYEHGVTRDWTPKARTKGRKLRILHHGTEATRKGGQQTVDAFLEVFGKDNEDVELVLKSNGPHGVRVEKDGFLFTPQEYSNNIKIAPTEMGLDELVSLYRRSHLMIYPSCLSEDTKILTKGGWKGPDEISENDLVAAPNSNFELEFLPIQEIIDYEYEGNMVSINNPMFDMRLTENHTMIWHTNNLVEDYWGYDRSTVGEFVEAMGEEDSISFSPNSVVANGGYNGRKIQSTEIPIPREDLPEFVSVQDLLYLLGSSIIKNKNLYGDPTKSNSRSGSSDHKISQAMVKLGIIDSKKTMLKIHSNNVDMLFGFDLENERRIPRWVYNFSAKNLESLVSGLVSELNNNHRETNFYVIDPSEGLKDDLQELCVHLGYESKMISVVNEEGDQEDRFVFVSQKTAGIIRHEDISVSEVKERVWCVKNQNSTIVCKRNDKIFVTGNCGEGFGLAPLQAMATGMPVIMPKEWASYSRFIDDGLAIPSRLVDSPWQEEHPGKVFEPNYESLVSILDFFSHRQEEYFESYYDQAEKILSEYDWVDLTEKAFDHIVNK